MGERRRRVGIVFLALAAAAVYLLGFGAWAVGRLGCEDADQEDFDTVRCDSERGVDWTAFEWVLWGLALVLLIGGLVWSLRRASYVGVLASAAAIVATVIAVFAIEGIELGEKEVPRVTDFDLIDTECRAPCSKGLRVLVSTNEDAELHLSIGPLDFDDIGGRQYNDLVDGKDTGEGIDVDAGTHHFNVGGEIVNPPAERGPLPPGEYRIEVYARPQDAGNQENASSEPMTETVVIRP